MSKLKLLFLAASMLGLAFTPFRLPPEPDPTCLHQLDTCWARCGALDEPYFSQCVNSCEFTYACYG